MKLECKIKRTEGTKVKVGKDEYHFKPDDNGVHCCEVTNKTHAKILLGIPEAYKKYGEADPEPEPEDNDGTRPAIDPEAMNNAALNKWAKDKKIKNPKSKQSIIDFAKKEYGIDLVLENESLANTIRMVVKLDLIEEAE